jgi:pimeloyl-ACP methyl ester carboxylesterase
MNSEQGRGDHVDEPIEDEVLLVPDGYLPDGSTTGVLYCHGAGGTARGITDPALVGSFRLAHAIAGRYPLLSCELGGPSTWGNDLAIERVGIAVDRLQRVHGARAGRVFLVGVSMGNLSAMGWAQRNVDRVAAIVGILPASDLDDLHANDRFEVAAKIDEAYGHPYDEPADGPARNPTAFARRLAGVPARLYYSTGDSAVPPATVIALAEAIGPSATAVAVSDLEHSEAAVAAIDPGDLLAFLDANDPARPRRDPA